MKKIGVALLVFVLLASCSSERLTKKQIVSEQETVIIAQFSILNSSKDVTKNSKIFFDENKKGVLTYRFDESGLLIMKLPKGNHFLKHIYTPYGATNLPDGYASISVLDHDKVYYIGSIEIDATGKLQKKSKGIVSDVQAKDLKETKPQIKIIDNSEKVFKLYYEEFGKEKTVSVALLQINE